jgi:methyl-accepting chemotaxis protein
MLAMIMTEPRATADLGQSRSVGMLILAGTAKAEHPARLIALATMSVDRELTIKRALTEAIKADPRLSGQLEQAISEAATASQKFLTTAHAIGTDKDAAKVEAKEYFAMGGAATAARYQLYETAGASLEKLLIERFEQKSLHRLLVVGGVSLLLIVTFLFATIILRDTTRRLAHTAQLADAAAQGRFDQTYRVTGSDEVARVAGAVMSVRDQLERLSRAQLDLQSAHGRGDTDYQIDASTLPGGFGVLATKLNELVASNNTVTFRFMEVVRQYSRGEFGAEMPRLPGKQAAITEAADHVRVTLVALAEDIDRIAAAASAGQFDARIDTRNYGATFGEMADALNALMQSIGTSVDSTQSVFRALASGDLTQRMRGRFEGAFAELQDNSNLTAERLQGLVEEIITAARAVDAGAREIAVGNSDLSRRTDEQAASLQEAGSALRLINDVVQRTAEHAKQADQLAQSASTVAARGGETMNQVITTMQALGTSARKVQEIIGVIDGIAFQTNILALNASVESARAGELGKGFAVVAAEVRMLAQRAAEAAREIKELITETVSRVEASTTLVGHTGEQMEEIVQSVKRVTDLIGEISAASAAQTQELTDVHAAVASIDTMTQRSAALAEQVAASTGGMREHAEQLVQKVGVFRISESDRSLRAAA